MDHQMSRSIWHPEMTIYRRTSTINAWPVKTVLNWIRCIKSGNRSSAYSTRLGWWPTSCSICVKNAHRYWNKIQNLWQRTPWNHSILERMETLSRNQHTPLLYFLITKTWCTSEQLRNWMTGKPDGHSTFQNLTLNWYIYQDQKWFNLMHCHDDPIME